MWEWIQPSRAGSSCSELVSVALNLDPVLDPGGELEGPLEFPRFRGHLMAVPTGRPERMSVDAKDAAVFEGVPG
jgi:hypothetical protein